MADRTQRRSGHHDRRRPSYRERSNECSILLTDLLPRRQRSPPRAPRRHHSPAQAPIEGVTGVRIVSAGTRTHPRRPATHSGRAPPVYLDEDITVRAPRERGPSGGYSTHHHRERTRRAPRARPREESSPTRSTSSPPPTGSRSYRPRTSIPSRPQHHAQEYAYPTQDLPARFERLNLSTGRTRRPHEEPITSYGTGGARHSEYRGESAPHPRDDDAYYAYQPVYPSYPTAYNPDTRRTTDYDRYQHRSRQSPPPEAYDPGDTKSHDESFTSESTKVEEPHPASHTGVPNAYAEGLSPPNAEYEKANTRTQDYWRGSDSTKVEECQNSSHTSVPHTGPDRPSRDLPMSRRSDSLGRLPVQIYGNGRRRIPARVSFDERGLFLVQTPLLSTLKLKKVDKDSVAAAMKDPEVCWTLSEQLTDADRDYCVEAFNKDGTERDDVDITLRMNPEVYETRWQWFIQQHRAITINPTLEDLKDGHWKVSFDLPLGIHVETFAGQRQEIQDSMDRGPPHWQIQFDPSAALSKLRFTGVGEDPATPTAATWQLSESLDDCFWKLWRHYESREWPESDDCQS